MRAARARRAGRPRRARPEPRARRRGRGRRGAGVGRAARIVATSSRRSIERSRKPYPPTVSSTAGSSCTRRSTTLRDAELGRAARPDRSEARGRRERHQRLGDVRQIGDDAVTGADAEPHEAGPRACHLLAEAAERELGRLARLRVGDHRDLVRVVVAADEVLGEVQPRTREPGRAGHRVGGEDRAVRGVRLDLEELPDRRPEPGQVVDRPAPQLVVARECEPTLALEPGEVAPDLGRLPNVRRRRPQDTPAVVAGRAIRWAPACAPC